MEEASGTRKDSHGGNDLTDNNTVGSAAGKIGNAANFVRTNSEYFTTGSTITLADDTTWSVSAWINITTHDNYPSLYGHNFVSTEYTRVFVQSSGTLLTLYNDANQLASWTVSLSTATWYHIVITCDGTDTSNLELFIDATSQGSKTLADSEQVINKIGWIGYTSGYPNDKLDEFSIWDAELTTDEIDWLYNSGDGRKYSDLLLPIERDSGRGVMRGVMRGV
jgi:hypothetical protein